MTPAENPSDTVSTFGSNFTGQQADETADAGGQAGEECQAQGECDIALHSVSKMRTIRNARAAAGRSFLIRADDAPVDPARRQTEDVIS